MSTSEPPADATGGSGPAAETTVIPGPYAPGAAAGTDREPGTDQGPVPGRDPGPEGGTQHRRLTASDVRAYATLAWFSVPLMALVDHAFMWVPPAVLFLVLRERDQAGLLRRHLAQALSFSAVLTVYALLIRYVLDAAGVHGRLWALYPVLIALAVLVPCVRGVQAARRLEPYTVPEPLAWIPLDRD